MGTTDFSFKGILKIMLKIIFILQKSWSSLRIKLQSMQWYDKANIIMHDYLKNVILTYAIRQLKYILYYKWFGKFLAQSSIFIILCVTANVNYATPPIAAAEAFKIYITQTSANIFAVCWHIKPGYYLYADRIKLSNQLKNSVIVQPLQLPSGIRKVNSQGKSIAIYRNKLCFPVAASSRQALDTTLSLHFQGCSDSGLCYPPSNIPILVKFNHAKLIDNVSIPDANMPNSSAYQAVTKPIASGKALSGKALSGKSLDIVLENIFAQHWSIAILSFFAFGLLLSFTPCVLPTIPVLSGIIMGQEKTLTTSKAFFLSSSYVLGMAITYAIIGVVAAFLGKNLQVLMQSPIALIAFSLIFILLALSMFEYYELRLPAWHNKFTYSIRHRSGYYFGSALMGALSILILSPCVTPPLIAAVSYISHNGNVYFGMLTLFFLALGMGTPLLLIGTSAGKLLPKAGKWMHKVKDFFGFLLLAVAINLLAKILPNFLSLFLWSSFLALIVIYIVAFIKPFYTHLRLHYGLALTIMLYGAFILTGSLMGNKNPLLIQETTIKSLSTNTVKSMNELQCFIQQAKNQHPVIIDFYAKWCTYCREMEATILQNPDVISTLKNFVFLKVDLTTPTDQNQAILQKYNVIGPPTFLFFDKQGQEAKKLRIVGEMSINKFLNILTQASY